VLEKATRALTEEEKKILDQDFVGKNGEKRKVEVLRYISADSGYVTDRLCTLDDYGSPEAEEVSPIRDQVARFGSQMEHLDTP
jgi:hypothetical protein